MNEQSQAYYNHEHAPNELRWRTILLGVILAVVLATSNTFLALKVGLLTSASIPAAILSMGILRFFKNSNVLENNMVQTTASAGEAVVGGLVYAIPALVILHYWDHFPYYQNFLIALIGGSLGVFFSIPLRRILVNDRKLPFPEGKAIAEVLIVGSKKVIGIGELVWGAIAGGLIELLQVGFKLIASYAQWWYVIGKSVVGVSLGFSATMLGAGYLIGIEIGLSIFIGAIFAAGVALPVLTSYLNLIPSNDNLISVVNIVWGQKIRYIGIGAMLVCGVWTLLGLFRTFVTSLKSAATAFVAKGKVGQLRRTDYDLPMNYVILGTVVMLLMLGGFFYFYFPITVSALTDYKVAVVLSSLFYVLIFGFIFSAICAYFSGLVGVTASPGSAITIAGIIVAALLLRLCLEYVDNSTELLLQTAAMTIYIGAIVQGAAAIANDNSQDLKVGYILGATPWKQQLMLLLGVVAAALVIPIVMELLFKVYGIADVLPRADMNLADSLPAPPAAMMAAVTQGVFSHNIPWPMMFTGMGVGVFCISIVSIIKRYGFTLSPLAIATGIYLPLATTTPLVIGSFISLLVSFRLRGLGLSKSSGQGQVCYQRSILLACGLVAGAALMEVILAIPFAMLQDSNSLRLLPKSWGAVATTLGVAVVIGLAIWFNQVVLKNDKERSIG
jgi:putative OPT family oligopeptide transporter